MFDELFHPDGRFGVSTGIYWLGLPTQVNRQQPLSVGAQLTSALERSDLAIEISAMDPVELAPIVEMVPCFVDAAGLEYVALHAPTRGPDPLGDEQIELIGRIIDWIDSIIVHPDILADAAQAEQLAAAFGPKLVFENMDIRRPDFRTVSELRPLYEAAPEAGLCLDLAHVWTVDRSMQLGWELLDAYEDRLRQLHLSGIDPSGKHRDMRRSDLDHLQRFLADPRCRRVAWILESELER